jgi:hypothetical protein
MVHEHIWQQLADTDADRLCGDCMNRRAVQRLGRMLTLADLRPCRWNLFGEPFSWFDLFVEEVREDATRRRARGDHEGADFIEGWIERWTQC